jgi:hypothetical protein
MQAALKYLLVLFCIQFSFSAFAGSGEEVGEEVKNHLNNSYVSNYEIKNVEVTYYGESQRDSNKVSRIIDEALDFTFIFLSEQHPDAVRCLNIPLIIYQIDDSVINDREIMSFFSWDGWENRDVNALYDAGTSAKKTSIIYLNNDIPDRSLKRILFHELLHYSQHMMCLPTSEAEAALFTSILF